MEPRLNGNHDSSSQNHARPNVTPENCAFNGILTVAVPSHPSASVRARGASVDHESSNQQQHFTGRSFTKQIKLGAWVRRAKRWAE